MRTTGIIIIWFMVLGLPAGVATAAQETAPEMSGDTIGRTPPRLSLVEGQVSFWRPGAEDWVMAQVNTALAPGDQLFAGPGSRMEIQIGAQAFVRGGADTQIGLEIQEPDFIQLKVTAGQAALDVRTIAPGRMVEVDTPNAAFTIDQVGYYRLDVGEERTVFITRRTGRATVISAAGDKIPIGPNEAVTVEGSVTSSISSQTAPPLDPLDKWNYARTDKMLEEQESVRYVSPETYGTSDLDRYGTWRIVPTYGAVWMPRGVAADWVPYSTGVWMHDPYYGWTWVDTAPWGWAPYHYGRWVHFNGYWCWAPGPRIVRPVYAPALVAFFGEPGLHVSVGISGPVVGWVSLSWGEPLIPWWGRPGFIHRPWWGGWAGPRIVNNKVIHHKTVVNITEINIYRNKRVRNAMVVVGKDHFGKGPITHARIRHRETRHMQPSHVGPRLAATPASLVPSPHRGMRPPEKHLKRSVVNAGKTHTGPAPAAGLKAGGSFRQPHRIASPSAADPRISDGHDTGTRIIHNRNRSAASPPTVRKDIQGVERRRDLPPPATRTKRPQTQQPARFDKPGAAAPRAPERPAAGEKHSELHRPEQKAVQPPAAAQQRGTHQKRSSTVTAPRIESREKGTRGYESGPVSPPPSVHSEPGRPQSPQRQAAPSRVETPRERRDHFAGSPPSTQPRQDRGHSAGSFNTRSDAPRPSSQRFERAAPEGAESGRRHSPSRNSR